VSDARAFTLTRHCRSTYNADGLLNGDPSIVVLLDAVGREQCEALRERLAGVPFDLGVHTRFPRTAQSLGLILGDRDVPRMEYPEFDDVQLGLFESRDVEEYRAWRPVPARVAVEAGVAQCWHKLVGDTGEIVSIEHFGESADDKTLFREFGFTPEAVVAAAERAMDN